MEKENTKGSVYGVGRVDGLPTKLKGVLIPSYECWRQMLKRCYSEIYLSKNPTYRYTVVCPEWCFYANFKIWYDENHINNYELDKDLRGNGNLYSPDTCCFLPKALNVSLITKTKCRKHSYCDKYIAEHSVRGKLKHLGLYATQGEAYSVYKREKERYIKELADEYFLLDKIKYNVYNALMNWTLEKYNE